MFVIDDICVLVVGLIEIGQAAAAFVEPAIEVAAAYKAGEKGVKAAGKAIDWAKAEINLRRLKQKLEDLKNSRPGEHGHPEWACKTGDRKGCFDMRRRPVHRLKKAIAYMEKAVKHKSGEALLAAIRFVAKFDDFAAGPEALVQSVENLQEVEAHMDEQLARVDEMLNQMKIK